MKKHSKTFPISLIIIMFLFLLATPKPIKAGEFALLGGFSSTLMTIPASGLVASASYRAEGMDWVFWDYQVETHYLTGNKTLTNDVTADVFIVIKTLQIGYSILLGDRNGLFYGPGIGYGWAIVTEDINTGDQARRGDPSPFFDNKDIHFGVLYLKGGKTWDDITCEGRLSSFGGLIGGDLICGLTF